MALETAQLLFEEKDAADFRSAAKVAGFNKSYYRISVNSLDSKYPRYACTEVLKEQKFLYCTSTCERTTFGALHVAFQGRRS
jgi:hypothetical protein